MNASSNNAVTGDAPGLLIEACDKPRALALKAGLIVLAALVVYIPALRAGFIWDDDTFLTNNPLIKAPDGLYRFWFTTQAPDYFPLTSSMLWFEWRVFGMHPAGYHVANVLLHAAGAILLWRVLLALGIPGAWLAGLIFAVHPVNVESVAWITQRKNTLPLVLYLLSILWFLKFDALGKRKWYWRSLAAFLLALLAKTSVVMLPAVLLGCVWWRRKCGVRTKCGVRCAECEVNRNSGSSLRTRHYALRTPHLAILRVLPFFLLAAGLSAVTVWFQSHNAIGAEAVRTDGVLSRLVIASWAIWFYLYKALVPWDLSFVYPRWSADVSSVLSYLPLAGLVVVAAVLLWFRQKPWARALLFAGGYFVVTLAPVLGFFNIYFMRYSLVADHWQYVAIIGPIALVCGAAAWVCCRRRQAALSIRHLALVADTDTEVSRFNESQRADKGSHLPGDANAKCLMPSAVVVARHLSAGALVLLLGVISFRQERIYHDTATLWQDVLAKNPNCWLAYDHIGTAAATRAEDPEHYPDPRERAPMLDDAIAAFQKAVTLEPNHHEGHAFLARAILLRPNPDVQKVVDEFRAALRVRGDFFDALTRLAWLEATWPEDRFRNGKEALELAQRACQLTRRQDYSALKSLAAAYAENRQYDLAVQAAVEAVKRAEAVGRFDEAQAIGDQSDLYYRHGIPFRDWPAPIGSLR